MQLEVDSELVISGSQIKPTPPPPGTASNIHWNYTVWCFNWNNLNTLISCLQRGKQHGWSPLQMQSQHRHCSTFLHQGTTPYSSKGKLHAGQAWNGKLQEKETEKN